MNIFVTSDTHGHLEKVYKMYEALSEMTLDGEPIDLIIHCGDYYQDAETIGDYLALPVIAAKGNCDGNRSRDLRFARTKHGSILVTHGHMEDVGYGLDPLSYLAEENDCIAACFGHTHVPAFEKLGNVWLINPGSLSFPRDGTLGSCALLNLSPRGLDGGIYYYQDIYGKQDSKKSSGGYLRNLINYSDRF